MARLSLNWFGGRTKAGGLYVVVALAVFGVVVFLLFRGRTTGPQEAAASGGAPAVSPASDPGHGGGPPAPASNPQPNLAGVVPVSAQAPTGTSAVAGAPTTAPAIDGLANPAVDSALAEATAMVKSQPSRIIEARDKLNAALKMPMSVPQRQAIKDEMGKLAADWLFGPAHFAGDTLCDTYTVKKGDLLDVIGRRHKVPYEFLMQINNISRPESLQADRAIKVVNGPFNAKVYRSTFTLDLYLQDTFVRSFRVGLGAPGSETPTGLWRVKDGGKLIQPPWTDKRTNRTYKATDPDYPLGSRWIALDGLEGDAKDQTGYAIHGTKDPNQIGTAASQGCIRMYNGEAVLMYNLLTPVYSQVEVLP
jgi:LysM repeat protein